MLEATTFPVFESIVYQHVIRLAKILRNTTAIVPRPNTGANPTTTVPQLQWNWEAYDEENENACYETAPCSVKRRFDGSLCIFLSRYPKRYERNKLSFLFRAVIDCVFSKAIIAITHQGSGPQSECIEVEKERT